MLKFLIELKVEKANIKIIGSKYSCIKGHRINDIKKSTIQVKHLIYFDKNKTELKVAKTRRKYKLSLPVKIN